ncbi:MAG TPA: WbqC family protein [Methylophilus sp.]
MQQKPLTVAIMQPYFLPYIGYFQLMAAVDVFVLYDNIKYTKKGWINRNRFLKNGQDAVFSLPLKSDSDSLNIDAREVSAAFTPSELLNQWRNAYRKAPYFDEVLPVLESIVNYPQRNLFAFLHHAVCSICTYLNITTKIVISSEVNIDHQFKSQAKVLAICRALGATRYINAIGGQALYDHATFSQHGIELSFIHSHLTPYPQFNHAFVPWLSIIDCMMFNSKAALHSMIHDSYDLV